MPNLLSEGIFRHVCFEQSFFLIENFYRFSPACSRIISYIFSRMGQKNFELEITNARLAQKTKLHLVTVKKILTGPLRCSLYKEHPLIEIKIHDRRKVINVPGLNSLLGDAYSHYQKNHDMEVMDEVIEDLLNDQGSQTATIKQGSQTTTLKVAKRLPKSSQTATFDYIYNINNKHNKNTSVLLPEEAIRLSELLRGLILENQPGNLLKDESRWKAIKAKWAKELERAHRIDKRPWEDLEQVIRWAQQDDFWWRNVQSGGTLRAKFDRLEANMRSARPKKESQLDIDMRRRQEALSDPDAL